MSYSENKITSKENILLIMKMFEQNKLFGGFEVKYEAGKITFVKDWRGKKY